MAHLAEDAAAGRKSVVFSQFTSFLNLIEAAMREAGVSFVRLDGSTPVAARAGSLPLPRGGMHPDTGRGRAFVRGWFPGGVARKAAGRRRTAAP